MTLRELRKHYPHWQWPAGGLVLLAVGLWWLFTGPGTAQLDSYKQCATAGYPLTDTNPPACDSGSQVFLGPAATPERSLPPASTQSYQLLVDGDSGGSYPQKNQIITSQAGWQTYWRTVHASLATPPPLITVDFSAKDVIALSSGPETTNGYTLKITGITVSAAGSTVSVTETIPTITCAVTNVATNRYFVAATAKLAPPITFQTTTEPRECPK